MSTREQILANVASDIANNTSGLIDAIHVRRNVMDLANNALMDQEKASFSEYNSNTASKILANESVWSNVAPITANATTVTVDFNNGYDFGESANNTPHILDGNKTLVAPLNPRNGKKGMIWFRSTGSTRTLTLASEWTLANTVETGPYSITTTEYLAVAYTTLGSNLYVTSILRIGGV